ncbi:MAG: HAMP domain-containing histidine kinase [Sandarakinorhabdus sp.]|nr:HAMP domain-containing histidine kinase [Sandarakinorhabdus sp.]
MPSGRIRPLLASTGFRIGLLQALLMMLAMVAAATAAWITTRELAVQDLRARITVEAEAIGQEATHEGLAAAAEAVAARAERPGALEYRLLGADGKRLAGDLEVPALVSGWAEFNSTASEVDGDRHVRMLVLTSDLGGGGRLSVGDDVARGTVMRDAIFRAFAIWGLVALVNGLAASIWLTRRALRRMDVVVATLAAAGQGDLAARTGFARQNGDDIDQLARGVDDMLDRVGGLVGALRRVSADVAHELRTPLTHLRQRPDQAAAATDAAARADALVLADADLGRTVRMFDAMLRLAELDAGLGRSRFAPFDLGEVVERVADAYRPDIEASGRQLSVATNGTAPIRGDADLVAQLLANLLDNAIKYTHAAARITITVAASPHEIGLVVADDGPGVVPDALATLAQPFRRGRASTGAAGSGLGLAIVDAVARLHGASCRFEAGNPGLVVRLAFPAVAA